MSIEELEGIKDDFINKPIYKGKCETGMFMILTIEAFKDIGDYTKGLCEIQKAMIVDQDKLEKRIKRLELELNDIDSIKIGGTD